MRMNRCREGAEASAIFHLPEAVLVATKMQQAVARVMALAACGAGNETAEVHSPAVVFLGNGKGGAAAAGDQEHARICCCRGLLWSPFHQASSTIAKDFFLR